MSFIHKKNDFKKSKKIEIIMINKFKIKYYCNNRY